MTTHNPTLKHSSPWGEGTQASQDWEAQGCQSSKHLSCCVQVIWLFSWSVLCIDDVSMLCSKDDIFATEAIKPMNKAKEKIPETNLFDDNIDIFADLTIKPKEKKAKKKVEQKSIFDDDMGKCLMSCSSSHNIVLSCIHRRCFRTLYFLSTFQLLWNLWLSLDFNLGWELPWFVELVRHLSDLGGCIKFFWEKE